MTYRICGETMNNSYNKLYLITDINRGRMYDSFPLLVLAEIRLLLREIRNEAHRDDVL